MAATSHNYVFGKNTFARDYAQLLDATDLDEFERAFIGSMYLRDIQNSEREYNRVTAAFYILTSAITVCAVLLTALLSVEQFDGLPEGARIAIFWVCWGLSVTVIVANKLLYTFSIPRRYTLGLVTLERMYSECRQYACQIGAYAGMSHKQGFTIFCEHVEKMRQDKMEKTAELVQAPAGAARTLRFDSGTSSDSDSDDSPRTRNIRDEDGSDSVRAGSTHKMSLDTALSFLEGKSTGRSLVSRRSISGKSRRDSGDTSSATADKTPTNTPEEQSEESSPGSEGSSNAESVLVRL